MSSTFFPLRRPQADTPFEFLTAKFAFSTHREFCMCGIHAHRGALISGILLFCFKFLLTAVWLKKVSAYATAEFPLDDEDVDDVGQHLLFYSLLSFVGALSTLCTGMMIYGNLTLQHRHYRPHLVIEVFNCCLIFLVALLTALGAFFSFRELPIPFAGDPDAGPFRTVVVVFVLAVGLVRWYFAVTIVRRSQHLVRLQTAEYFERMGMKEPY
ncbi:hypothetical protein M3Y99_01391400 [Aphelenchoides fujianensis]|nr:hypothetical protein M3Y99_01391400 [Aphelenchoides fujianensis]